MPLRVKAAAVGLPSDEYRHGQASDPTWTGMAELDLDESQINALYAGAGAGRRRGGGAAVPHRSGAALAARVGTRPGDRGQDHHAGTRRPGGAWACTAARPSSGSRWTCCSTSRSGIVSLGGRAGTGKSALALCAGLEQVLERRRHKKVIVFRPLFAVGGQELGYLPGTEAEKMSPWGQAVFDTLGAVVNDNVLEEVMTRGMLEVLPLTHIRGRSLHDAFVIVDEAQSLERGVLLTVLSRIGTGSRVVLTHDVAQRDNLRVGRHDGVVAVIEALKGHPLFAHVTLTRSERSPIAEVVTDLLEDLPG